MKKTISLIVGLAVVMSSSVAYAHVVVSPKQVGIASFEVFSVSVPTEKDISTVGLKLLMPSGLKEVFPTAKSGWKISVKKTGTGDDANVTEIDWIGGSIPAGERDDFSFSAQVPSTPTTLAWKAYQTYQDGSVVSWDETPIGSDDAVGDKGPYSVTSVIDDLDSQARQVPDAHHGDADSYAVAALPVSLAALGLSIAALIMARKQADLNTRK